MAAKAISASVGDGGKNLPADVLLIQSLLNEINTAKVLANGICGADTIAAIRAFQKTFLPNPDGRIDPGGTTFHRLVKKAEGAFIVLPQVGGNGYYSYSPTANQYGTKATIQAVLDVAGTFRINMPNIQLGIGDISFAQGGHMPPHVSHTNGKNVDIRPLRTDGKMLGVTISEAAYSREYTKLLVASLRAHKNVQSILFNDKQISGVTSWAGHDNHLHVNMKE